jgi:mono/diheme cytochrome c family protein
VTGYGFVLFLHSALRWGVLVAGVLALGAAVSGWVRARPFGAADERVQHAFVRLADLQFLLGLGLYLFMSPMVDAFWDAPRVALKDHTLRFFGIEHVTTMVVAVAVLNVGRARAKRAPTDRRRFRTSSLACFFALALMGAAIPWPGLRHGRPLLRGFSVASPALPSTTSTLACPPVFGSRCSACHGAEGGGDGPGAMALNPPPRSFRVRGWDAGKSDPALAAVIREGGARHGLSVAMPAHSDLSNAEIDDLVRCVRTFQSRADR